jgi:hypothetical protein
LKGLQTAPTRGFEPTPPTLWNVFVAYRVTRLGDFLPIGPLFTLGRFYNLQCIGMVFLGLCTTIPFGVTRLGDFSPNVSMFALYSYAKMTVVARIFGLLYSIILTKPGLGYIFGESFTSSTNLLQIIYLHAGTSCLWQTTTNSVEQLSRCFFGQQSLGRMFRYFRYFISIISIFFDIFGPQSLGRMFRYFFDISIFYFDNFDIFRYFSSAISGPNVSIF